jgi:hypothetical protein
MRGLVASDEVGGRYYALLSEEERRGGAGKVVREHTLCGIN